MPLSSIRWENPGIMAWLDAEVAQHGIGFPAAQEHDGVLVDIGAEQSCSSPRAERAGADELGTDAGAAVAGVGGMAQVKKVGLMADQPLTLGWLL
jgi:hypothetical protein